MWKTVGFRLPNMIDIWHMVDFHGIFHIGPSKESKASRPLPAPPGCHSTVPNPFEDRRAQDIPRQMINTKNDQAGAAGAAGAAGGFKIPSHPPLRSSNPCVCCVTSPFFVVDCPFVWVIWSVLSWQEISPYLRAKGYDLNSGHQTTWYDRYGLPKSGWWLNHPYEGYLSATLNMLNSPNPDKTLPPCTHNQPILGGLGTTVLFFAARRQRWVISNMIDTQSCRKVGHSIGTHLPPHRIPLRLRVTGGEPSLSKSTQKHPENLQKCHKDHTHKHP